MPVPILIAAAALKGLAVLSGRKKAKKEKQAARLQQQAARLQANRDRLQIAKQFRQARAEALSGQVASGADIGSSGFQGIRGSLQSQLQDNTEFALEQESLGAATNRNLEGAARYGNIANVFQTTSGILGGIQATKPFQPTAPVPPKVPPGGP